MKILHIISGGDSGGAKTHMFTMLDKLVEMADVTVVCLMKGVFYNEILSRNVRTVLLEQKSRMDLSVCGRLLDMIESEGFDIVNAHGARANFVVAHIIRKIKIPVVTTIHSDYRLDFDVLYKKILFESLNENAIKKIRYKIAVSDAFAEMLIDRGFLPNDIYTVYNGMSFDSEESHCSKEEFAERFSIPYDKDKVYVGIAARLDKVKGVDVFVDIAAKVLEKTDRARFVVIGDGDERENLLEQCKRLGISDKIYFLGFVREVYDFLNFIDINMLTSISESFPYSILEGAKAKKATVSSAVGGIPYLVKDGQTGYLFPPRDSDAGAEKLLSLFDDPAMIRKLGENIYALASEKFSDRALAEKYMENYRSIIGSFNRKKRYDVVLSGYYGYMNAGDDIILATLVGSLRKHSPGLSIAVMSKTPDETEKNLRVDAYPRFDLPKIAKLFRNSRLYINGGGTLLTDVTSTRSLIYYVHMMKKAKKSGMKTLLLGGGVGPFRSASNRRRAIGVLKEADLITLRDKGSYDLLVSNGIKGAMLTADVAFGFSPEIFDPDHVYEIPGVSGGKYFVISLRECRDAGDDFEKNVARACDDIAGKYGMIPVFLPMQTGVDQPIAVRTSSMMKTRAVVIDGKLGINDIGSVISGASFSLGMRLHSVICSVSSGVPTLAISYDDKVRNFVAENDVGEYIEAGKVTAESLVRMADETMRQSPDRSKIENLRAASDKNITLALKLLDGSGNN
ncbi:MAG: polysaccharide pyruvyl transferase CsaB [Clostridia bacterium]|nr:polysaccharide pyruvyl transferase CsaB [Clostridia bacterium]